MSLNSKRERERDRNTDIDRLRNKLFYQKYIRAVTTPLVYETFKAQFC